MGFVKLLRQILGNRCGGRLLFTGKDQDFRLETSAVAPGGPLILSPHFTIEDEEFSAFANLGKKQCKLTG